MTEVFLISISQQAEIVECFIGNCNVGVMAIPGERWEMGTTGWDPMFEAWAPDFDPLVKVTLRGGYIRNVLGTPGGGVCIVNDKGNPCETLINWDLDNFGAIETQMPPQSQNN